MLIIADLSKGKLLVGDSVFAISCKVRTLQEGTRASHEVVLSIPKGLPYDPRPFPKGSWNITGIEYQKDKRFDPRTYGPVKIRTDAFQMVKVWELDGDKDYLQETDRLVKDIGYLLHYSNSSTTLGCIRLSSPNDAETIATIVKNLLNNGENVQLDVI